MASADRFEDQLEGTMPRGEMEGWKRNAANAENDEQRRTFNHNLEFLRRYAHGFRRDYYISCWHMNQHENRVMWDFYTRGTFEAVAIRTTYMALRDCLPPYIMMGTVRYIDYETERLPTGMNMFEYIMHKDINYNFEREVRAVAFFPRVVNEEELPQNVSAKQNLADEDGFLVYRPPVDPQRLIHQVVLHPKAGASFRISVATLCAQNGIPSPQAPRFTP